TFADTVPDASTIWLFAETLKSENMERHLFDLYNEELFKQGIEVKCGCIMDSTFVEVPVQRNTREQNAQIKNGIVPAEFIADPRVGSHKDTDARHAKKGDEEHFGYKNHVLVDTETKYSLDYTVTAASVHDSMECLDLMPPVPRCEGEESYADSAYVGSERNPIQSDLKERGFTVQVCEKGIRNNPLTFWQRLCNNVKSRVRGCVKTMDTPIYFYTP
ncbi:MAG: transposase, partial [Planctomycetaceae bacterium]|nr:transposase [Planctomycetaceae bacterium]